MAGRARGHASEDIEMASNDKGVQSDDVKKLGKLIQDIQYAMLTTAMPDGTLRSRPMATQKAEFDGTLWFFTDRESGKVHEVEQDRHVNVAYADTAANTWVSVSGTANVVTDKPTIRDKWTSGMKAWFPDGPDDPNVALLKVTVQQAEYWDQPSSKMVQLIGLVKATVVGERYEPGENKKINL
jgi:general stress protein 26